MDSTNQLLIQAINEADHIKVNELIRQGANPWTCVDSGPCAVIQAATTPEWISNIEQSDFHLATKNMVDVIPTTTEEYKNAINARLTSIQVDSKNLYIFSKLVLELVNKKLEVIPDTIESWQNKNKKSSLFRDLLCNSPAWIKVRSSLDTTDTPEGASYAMRMSEALQAAADEGAAYMATLDDALLEPIKKKTLSLK